MDLYLFSLQPPGGIYFLLKYVHVGSSIIWIGFLFYFAFIQEPFLSKIPQDLKKISQKIVLPKILSSFRWSSLVTLITGYLMITIEFGSGRSHSDPWTVKITAGALIGTLMWFNVWFVLSPIQKLILKQNQTPSQAQIQKSLRVVRTNTILSIPILFFMGAARNLPIQPSMIWLAIIFSSLVLIQINALKPFFPLPFKKAQYSLISGFLLTTIFYILSEIFQKPLQ